jgi:hypothetical protein
LAQESGHIGRAALFFTLEQNNFFTHCISPI